MRYFYKFTAIICLLFSSLSFGEIVTFTHADGAIGTNDYNSQGISSFTNGFYHSNNLQPNLTGASNPIIITFLNIQSQVSITLVTKAATGTLQTYTSGDVLIETITMSTGSSTVYTTTLGNIKYIKITQNSGFNSYDDLTFPTGLPVELTSFTSILRENSVLLNWATATEVNNYGFNVERKTETRNWETISFVQGHGNSNSPKEYSFTDSSPFGGNVQYRLKQIDFDGAYKYYGPVNVTVNVAKFALNQNYPNPFNPVTIISYAIPQKALVNLTVYDVLGREVTNLVNKEEESGVYNVQFNGSNLNSGIYFYELKAGNYSEVKKLLLVK